MSFWLSRYQGLTDWLCRSSLLRSKVAPARIQGFWDESWQRALPSPGALRTTWFHAASAGELEILIPLIQELHEKGIPIGVSVFSESALAALSKLPEGLLYSGFSPRESRWKTLLENFRAERVIVAKYEAWPGLWAACSTLDVPLILVNAQERRSLRWVRRFLKLFSVLPPRLYFFVADEAERKRLQRRWPLAKIEAMPDPRWTRIIRRTEGALQHPRVRHYRDLHAQAPHPYGVVGSAWMEDLKQLVPAFRSLEGTLWVVPHSLAPEGLQAMREYLEREIPGRFVLVDEMGILTELYSLADWVWVGGGFGKGIHSTMEPAVYGVPIGCGPVRVEEFFETKELRKHGLLTVCRDEAGVLAWLKAFQEVKPLALPEKTEGFSRWVAQCLQIR